MNMKNSGIYQILNTDNGKRYIGSAINIDKRWKCHLSELRGGTHKNKHLQNAFNKYGESAFEFIILEVQTPEGLIPLEQFYIDELQPDYNILPTAGSSLGYYPSEKTKRKLSKANKGNKNCLGNHHSEETRKKMSESHKGLRKGKHLSEETRKKMSIAKKGNKNALGHHLSEEARKKMSIARKKYWVIKKQNQKKGG